MKLSTLNLNDLTHNIIDQIIYTGIEDQQTRADCIMVLGSINTAKYRLPHAASLYFQKRAPKILVTGGIISGGISQAYTMKDHLISLGVPADDILTEEKSTSTLENMTMSNSYLSDKQSSYHKIILVTTTFHMKRALLMARRYMPTYEILPSPADDTNSRKDNWSNTEAAYNRVKGEAIKILSYIQEQKIDDQIIEMGDNDETTI